MREPLIGREDHLLASGGRQLIAPDPVLEVVEARHPERAHDGAHRALREEAVDVKGEGEAPTLREQTAAAFLGDIGITSPVMPNHECGQDQDECKDSEPGGKPEIEEDLFDFVVKYTALVAVPIRRDWQAPEVLEGRDLFPAFFFKKVVLDGS